MPRPARKAARKLVPVPPMGYKKTESQERQTDPPDPGKEKSCQDSWNAQRRPAELPNSLRGLWSISLRWLERRLLAGHACNEDAAVLTVPQGKALVQSVDILAPIVNEPFPFGRIAACNALSDIFAMGGTPWSAMSVACFPEDLAEEKPQVLADVLRGAFDAMIECGCVSAGGHTVSDDDMKFGLSVTGVIDPECVATNDGFRPGMRLILTKPLGIGILATAVKAGWEGAGEVEADIIRWAGRLNSVAGSAIQRFHLTGATDVTGFGLGGHALEVARASDVSIRIFADRLPVLPRVSDYAGDGLVPAGSIRNRKFAACSTIWDRPHEDDDLLNIIFDAQTSGGLLLAVPPEKLGDVRAFLREGGDLDCEIGEVIGHGESRLYIV